MIARFAVVAVAFVGGATISIWAALRLAERLLP